jgi:hypothetical protein
MMIIAQCGVHPPHVRMRENNRTIQDEINVTEEGVVRQIIIFLTVQRTQL